MSVNERIKKVREALRITQKDLAEKLNVGLSTVADIERGRIYPNHQIISGLHEYFDIDLNWLLCGSGRMKREQITIVEDPKQEYGSEIKDKYIKVLEENIVLQKQIVDLRCELQECQAKLSDIETKQPV